MPSPVSDQAPRPRSGRSPAPGPPADPGRSRAPRHLESSFSVEAILARPELRAPAASLLSACAPASSGVWTAPARCPASGLPWASPAARLPASLRVGLFQPLPRPPALGLRVAHLGRVQGLGVAGMRCPGGRRGRRRVRHDRGHRLEEFGNRTRWAWRGPRTLDLAVETKAPGGGGWGGAENSPWRQAAPAGC